MAARPSLPSWRRPPLVHSRLRRPESAATASRLTGWLACLLCLMTLLAVASSSLAGGNAGITALTHELDDSGLRVNVTTTVPVVFNAYELPDPPRVVVDLAEAFPTEGASLPSLPENPVAAMTVTTDTTGTPARTRLIFTPKGAASYKAQSSGNHISIQITPGKQPQPPSDTEARPAVDGASPVVRAIDVVKSPLQTLVRIKADAPLTDYRPNVLEKKGNKPPCLYLDINGVTGANLPQRQEVGGVVTAIRTAQRQGGLRVVLDAAGEAPFPYTIASMGDSLEITIPDDGNAPGKETPAVDLPAAGAGLPRLRAAAPAAPAVEQRLPSALPPPRDRAATLRDKFNIAASDKQRISVDFYKIDLHNVFRLIREISGSNIVVHEDVKGSLTLALNDVPWDFALDIVLNLKGLHKEERDNTIVILPKDKGFTWPERGGGNLEFEADANLASQEAIIIQQQQNIPREQLEARPLIHKGRQAEAREEYETAVEAYGKALALWPGNAGLANHMANLCLVRLGRNAQALHLARQALTIDASLHAAALNAAIAAANMGRIQEAGQYFDQSVSGAKPAREALLSYSVFAEEGERFDAAALLLKKHNDLHGPTLDSMVALARVQDKQNRPEEAAATYRAVLHGGFRLPPDLEQYIQARVTHSPARRSTPAQP